MPSEKRQKRRTSELFALAEVAKTLSRPLDLQALLDAVMGRIDDVLDPAEFGIVLLWHPSEGLLRPEAACGQGFQNLPALYEMALKEGESITGKVFSEGTTRLLSTPAEIAEVQADMQESNRSAMLRAFDSLSPRSLVAAPLRVGEYRYGVLILGTLLGPPVISRRDVPFVEILSELIALAIDRARLETEAAAIRDAEHSDRLRAEALATLSHELRTPLAAIKGYSTALLLDEVSWPVEKQREFLRLVDEECNNLQTMINDILDSSLIDVGQLSLEYQPVRLERLANEVADEMQRRTDAHKLVVDFPATFPILDADPLRIKQVIRNIVDNAIKYSPDGGLVVIRGEVRPMDVVISIADQGVGISPEDLIPLFEKYFRVKSPTGYHVPGTGLGLPVARAIVEVHGGRIWAESKVKQGTTLYFSLPRAGESAGIHTEPARTSAPSLTGSSSENA